MDKVCTREGLGQNPRNKKRNINKQKKDKKSYEKLVVRQTIYVQVKSANKGDGMVVYQVVSGSAYPMMLACRHNNLLLQKYENKLP